MTGIPPGGGVRLPIQPLTAAAVLRLVNDPGASNAELARLVEIDPALSANVMRLANSPHLGVSGKVASARTAVVMLGQNTVVSLAASGTASLVWSTDETVAPPGYWTHSIATALASAAIARRTKLAVDEAFTAGLLHDLGSVVLHRAHPNDYAELIVPPGATLCEAEREQWGRAHTDAGADLLHQWFLPERIVRAVREHHFSPVAIGEPLSRCVAVGHCLASRIAGADPRERPFDAETALHSVGLEGERPASLIAEIERELEQLSERVSEAVS